MGETIEQVEEDSKITTLKTVSIGNRFVHFIIDLIFMYILWLIFGLIIGVFGLHSLTRSIDNHGILYSIFSFFIYYVFCEYLFGRTLGKLFTKSVVVAEKGEKPSLGKIILRSLIRNVPFEPLSVLSATSKMWHDTWTNTVVVKTESIQHRSPSD